MPYLAISSLSAGTILLGDGATTHRAHELSLPAPSPLPWVVAARVAGAYATGDEYAGYSLLVDCIGDTQAAAEAAVIELSNVVSSHRARLLWRPHTAAPTLYTTIRSAQVVERGEYSHADRSRGELTVRLSIIADESWTDTAGVEISPDAITGPGTFDVPVSRGDRPGLLQLKVTSSSANASLGIGRKRAPGSGYAPIDTYDSPTAASLTSAYAALAASPNIDTNDNRGAHIVVPRVTTNPTAAASTRYRPVSKVTSSGMSDTTDATYDSTPALATGAYRWTPLPGTVDIPAGGVPNIETGSGLGEPQAVDAYATGVDSVPIGDGVYRTMTLPGGQHDGFDIELVNAAATSRTITVELRSGSPSGSLVASRQHHSVPGSFDGAAQVRWASPPHISSGTYAMVITAMGGDSRTDVSVVGNRGVAGSGINTQIGWTGGAWKASPETLMSQGSGTAYANTWEYLDQGADAFLYQRERQTVAFSGPVRVTTGFVYCRSESGTREIDVVVSRTGGSASTAITGITTTAHSRAFTLGAPLDMVSGSVSFQGPNLPPGIYGNNPPESVRIYHATNNPYPDGIRIRTGAWGDGGEYPTHDLRMSLTGYTTEDYQIRSASVMRSALGFDAAVTIEGKCSESSKTATLSHVGRLPDDGALVVVHDFAAGEGVIVDEADPLSGMNLYRTTATAGTAGPVVQPSADIGSLRPEPGLNRYIVLADGTITVSGSYWPRYSHAAAEALS